MLVAVLGLLVNLIGIAFFHNDGHSHSHTHSHKHKNKNKLELELDLEHKQHQDHEHDPIQEHEQHQRDKNMSMRRNMIAKKEKKISKNLYKIVENCMKKKNTMKMFLEFSFIF